MSTDEYCGHLLHERSTLDVIDFYAQRLAEHVTSGDLDGANRTRERIIRAALTVAEIRVQRLGVVWDVPGHPDPGSARVEGPLSHAARTDPPVPDAP